MASYEENGNVLRYRLDSVSRTVDRLLDWRREVDKERIEIANATEDLEEKFKTILDRVDALYKMFLGFIITIAGSTFILCLSILLATNKI